ncbi:uncharacterized protein EV422DRAFT_496532, partial [Fimicolochytrium jonesii]|uniref:uncharacterized protein n=1 Tax=Fimicolochytrium jonesii TaxID=1396493 RepID=UPI0022FE8650
LLYPKEDRAERKLTFNCRHCNHSEEAEFTQVYSHVVSATAREQTAEEVALASDPTFPRANNIKCPKYDCTSTEAVFYHSRSKHRDATMKLFYSCVKCGHRFTIDPAAEKENEADAET